MNYNQRNISIPHFVKTTGQQTGIGGVNAWTGKQAWAGQGVGRSLVANAGLSVSGQVVFQGDYLLE